MNLILNEILYFYDEPQVFSSYDELGVNYISVLTDEDFYLTVQVNKMKFDLFLKSKIDLLELILTSKKVGLIDNIKEPTNFVFKEISHKIRDSWLPDKGFVLDPLSAEDLAIEARKTRSCLAAIGIEASEAKDELLVYTDKLAEFIQSFEKVFDNLYGNMLKRMNKKQRSIKKESGRPRFFVSGMVPGSFKVQLRSNESLDLFEDSISAEIMSEFQRVIYLISNGDRAILKRMLKSKYDGRTTASLLKMSEVILKKDTDLYFEWATPTNYSGKIKYNRESAKFMRNNFLDGEVLDEEDVFCEGSFVKVDIIGKSWTIISSVDGKDSKISGKLSEENDLLDGISVNDRKYKLKCSKVIKYDFSKGKEVDELYLIERPKKL